MTDTLTIREAARFLNYKDIRSVEKWCAKNDVKIFSEDGSNKKYMMRMQFEHARLKKFIDFLKVKFKKNWLEAFRAYTSMNITTVVEIEEKEKGTFSLRANNYKSQGENETRFLNNLKAQSILTAKSSEL